MGEWHPIDTAPKEIVYRDRTPFGNLVHEYGPHILAWPCFGEVMRVRWWQSSESTDGHNSNNFIADGGLAVRPSHWMPLPGAPNA